jgi:hypothetical protein
VRFIEKRLAAIPKSENPAVSPSDSTVVSWRNSSLAVVAMFQYQMDPNGKASIPNPL